MNIQIANLIPTPLKDRDLNSSEIWNTSYSFEQGKKYHIYAPSGSGKTTFLHSLFGIRKDYSGNILIDNQKLDSINIDEFRKSDVAIIFQDLMLFPDLTARENILVKSELTNIQNNIEKQAELLNVKHLLNKEVKFLSRGEKQRIAILRALAMDFKWILMDEPFSHLDEEITNTCIQLIQERISELNAGLVLCNVSKDTYFDYDVNLNL